MLAERAWFNRDDSKVALLGAVLPGTAERPLQLCDLSPNNRMTLIAATTVPADTRIAWSPYHSAVFVRTSSVADAMRLCVADFPHAHLAAKDVRLKGNKRPPFVHVEWLSDELLGQFHGTSVFYVHRARNVTLTVAAECRFDDPVTCCSTPRHKGPTITVVGTAGGHVRVIRIAADQSITTTHVTLTTAAIRECQLTRCSRTALVLSADDCIHSIKCDEKPQTMWSVKLPGVLGMQMHPCGVWLAAWDQTHVRWYVPGGTGDVVRAFPCAVREAAVMPSMPPPTASSSVLVVRTDDNAVHFCSPHTEFATRLLGSAAWLAAGGTGERVLARRTDAVGYFASGIPVHKIEENRRLWMFIHCNRRRRNTRRKAIPDELVQLLAEEFDLGMGAPVTTLDPL